MSSPIHGRAVRDSRVQCVGSQRYFHSELSLTPLTPRGDGPCTGDMPLALCLLPFLSEAQTCPFIGVCPVIACAPRSVLCCLRLSLWSLCSHRMKEKVITDVRQAVGTRDEKRHGMLLWVVIKNYILEFFCKKDKGRCWGCGSKNHQKRRAQEDKLPLFYFPLWVSKRPEQF